MSERIVVPVERAVAGAPIGMENEAAPAGAEAQRESGPRIRGGLPLAMIAPGAPQILAGRWLSGGGTLVLWMGLVTLGVWRWDRVTTAPSGALDEQLAFVTLIVGLTGAWLWSVRDFGKGRTALSPARSQWRLASRSFRRNRMAVGALGVIGLFYLIALLTPFIAPFDPTFQGDLMQNRLAGPSAGHLLGTDQFARDVLSRLLYGSRISLSIGLIAVTIAVTIGTLLGATAAFLGGVADTLIMRFVDMVISFPRLVLLITIVALFEPSIILIMVILGLTQWPHVTRLVRGEVLSLREREFIHAGTALGFSKTRMILRHVIPNILAPVIVAASLGIGDTIILEAGLSFLGLGVQPPNPSWGTMVADGRNHLLGAWWITTFPGLAIVVVVLSFNLAGDGLRDALDPRSVTE